jgi:hypothetical protein
MGIRGTEKKHARNMSNMIKLGMAALILDI